MASTAHEFVRVSVCSPEVSVGNPQKNVTNMLAMLDKLETSDVVVFPELCITGYTCGDLFQNSKLYQKNIIAVEDLMIAHKTADIQKRAQLLIVGCPVRVDNRLFNCAVVISEHRIIGIVPKTNIPNYKEFYESRWFRSANGTEPKTIQFGICPEVPFGIDLLFKCSNKSHRRAEIMIGVEICEDLWMPIPPSSHQAIAGANILVNLSASNETVGKSEYRKQLVANQSGRCVAAYAYASAGPDESTSDLVFGGHCLIAENGHILKESDRVGTSDNLQPHFVTLDVDIGKLMNERQMLSSFGEASHSESREFRIIPFRLGGGSWNIDLERKVDGRPFIPKDKVMLKQRCTEIFGIQCAGLAKRLKHTGTKDIYIGVSGGLDSTLALLVAAKTYKQLGYDPSNIHGITMPGFGTTEKTLKNSLRLMNILKISQNTIDIRQICLQMFRDINHSPFKMGWNLADLDGFVESLKSLSEDSHKQGDLVFENVQARVRTSILMAKGFVLGTGDLSELALGWCTYNGDHMSMYNVNASIPKTLVKFLVEYVMEHEAEIIGPKGQNHPLYGPPLFSVLEEILWTIVSPELLPPDKDGKIRQSTEDHIGPYELHDFYLANFVRNGFSPEKILFLSDHAEFSKEYPRELRVKTMNVFIDRFFKNQFKRDCVPNGPKVGSVSLSPRGDWRMPSDADSSIWKEDI